MRIENIQRDRNIKEKPEQVGQIDILRTDG